MATNIGGYQKGIYISDRPARQMQEPCFALFSQKTKEGKYLTFSGKCAGIKKRFMSPVLLNTQKENTYP